MNDEVVALEESIWDEVRVGDPRPPYHGTASCWDAYPGIPPYVCNRRSGHGGRHVAAGLDEVFAVWEVKS